MQRFCGRSDGVQTLFERARFEKKEELSEECEVDIPHLNWVLTQVRKNQKETNLVFYCDIQKSDLDLESGC